MITPHEVIYYIIILAVFKAGYELRRYRESREKEAGEVINSLEDVSR